MITTNNEEQTTENTLNRSTILIRKGIIAGLAGGLAFGSLMAFVGMLPMVGMLIRQENALVGFLLHMIISAIIGAGFGGVMALYTQQRPIVTILIGLGYGLFWWVFGALFLMPLLLGMPENIMVVGQMQIDSLIGHLIYGFVISIVVNMLPS
jgi:uncharacterized membrane protein YagU involved in acid resistance